MQKESSLAHVAEVGYMKPLTSVSVIDKNDIIAAVTTFHLFIKVKAAMDQFQQGLELAGVLKYMKKYTDMMRPLFVDESQPFTASKIGESMGV